MVEPIRVMIADDHAMVAEALAGLLGQEDGIEVVALAHRGDQVLPTWRAAAPDVVLLDVVLPPTSGLDLLDAIRAESTDCAVIMVTAFGRPGYVLRAAEAGASGFILKDAPLAQLVLAIRQARSGQLVVDPALAQDGLVLGPSPLTKRETEVLRAAAAGATSRAMARQLCLSPGTVRNHLSQAMAKLGVASRTQAVHLAQERGWL